MQKADGGVCQAQRLNGLRRAAIGVLAFYWVALVVGTHWPGLGRPTPMTSDKLLHFSAYLGLALLLTLVISWGLPFRAGRFVLLLLLLAAFGAMDELTQPPFNRSADWFDWYSDVAGVLAGLLLAGLAIAAGRRAAVRRAASKAQSGQ